MTSLEFPRCLPGLPIYDSPEGEELEAGFAKAPHSWAMVAIAFIPHGERVAKMIQSTLNSYYPETNEIHKT